MNFVYVILSGPVEDENSFVLSYNETPKKLELAILDGFSCTYIYRYDYDQKEDMLSNPIHLPDLAKGDLLVRAFKALNVENN